MAYLKKQFHDVPSVHMAYIAAILSRAGHDVLWTRGDEIDGDVALTLSSLVDYKSERPGPTDARPRREVGFIGITASKMPKLFADHCDSFSRGNRGGAMRLAPRLIPSGIVVSEQITISMRCRSPMGPGARRRQKPGRKWFTRPVGAFPAAGKPRMPGILHVLPAPHSSRAIAHVDWEHRGRARAACDQQSAPYVIFRDPLFTEQRTRCLELCDEIHARGLTLTFEAETRLDRLTSLCSTSSTRPGSRHELGVESLTPPRSRSLGAGRFRRPISGRSSSTAARRGL